MRRFTVVAWIVLGLSVVLLLCISLRLTTPAILSQRLIGKGTDLFEFFADMTIVMRNLAQFHHPFSFTTTLRYPVGFDFSYGFDGVFADLTGGILGLFLPLVIAYNMTVFLIALTNVYLSVFFFRKIGHTLRPSEGEVLRTLKSCAAGLLFGLSPYVIAKLNAQLNLSFVPGFAALAWALVAAFAWHAQRRVSAHTVLRAFVVSFILLFAGSLQYVLTAALLTLPLCLFVRLFHVRRFLADLTQDGRALSISLFSAGGAVLLFLFFFHGYLLALLAGSMHFQDGFISNPPFINLIIPNGIYGAFWNALHLSCAHISRGIFLGASAMIIWAAFLFGPEKRRWKILSLLMAAYVLVLLFGLLKFPVVQPLIIRRGEGGRFVIGIMLLTACLLVLSKTFSGKTLLLVCAVIVVERLVLTVGISPPLHTELLNSIQSLSGQGVVVASPGSRFSDVVPYFTGKSVVDGYFQYNADTDESQAFRRALPLSLFSCRARQPIERYETAMNMLWGNDIQVVLAKKNGCGNLRSSLMALEEEGRLRKAGEDFDWQVYLINPPRK